MITPHTKRPGRVLIVDDEQPMRALLARWLTKWGCAVSDAGSASQALALMAADPADILLCDIGMPDRDGLWLAEQVRTRWPGTAIIMSTGRDDAATVRASRKAGAVAYVLKPVNPVLLRSAIEDTARA
jgi:DNA-binding response OmpR family regulator